MSPKKEKEFSCLFRKSKATNNEPAHQGGFHRCAQVGQVGQGARTLGIVTVRLLTALFSRYILASVPM
jgi:hypothetical protein